MIKEYRFHSLDEYDKFEIKNNQIICPYSIHFANCTTYYDLIDGKVKVHRISGPAKIWYGKNNAEWWYYNGLLHREDGPAIEESEKFSKRWYWHGTEIFAENLEDFKRKVKLLLIK